MIELAGVITTLDGRVIGFATLAEMQVFLATQEGKDCNMDTVYTKGAYVRHAREWVAGQAAKEGSTRP